MFPCFPWTFFPHNPPHIYNFNYSSFNFIHIESFRRNSSGGLIEAQKVLVWFARSTSRIVVVVTHSFTRWSFRCEIRANINEEFNYINESETCFMYDVSIENESVVKNTIDGLYISSKNIYCRNNLFVQISYTLSLKLVYSYLCVCVCKLSWLSKWNKPTNCGNSL